MSRSSGKTSGQQTDPIPSRPTSAPDISTSMGEDTPAATDHSDGGTMTVAGPLEEQVVSPAASKYTRSRSNHAAKQQKNLRKRLRGQNKQEMAESDSHDLEEQSVMVAPGQGSAVASVNSLEADEHLSAEDEPTDLDIAESEQQDLSGASTTRGLEADSADAVNDQEHPHSSNALDSRRVDADPFEDESTNDQSETSAPAPAAPSTSNALPPKARTPAPFNSSARAQASTTTLQTSGKVSRTAGSVARVEGTRSANSTSSQQNTTQDSGALARSKSANNRPARRQVKPSTHRTTIEFSSHDGRLPFVFNAQDYPMPGDFPQDDGEVHFQTDREQEHMKYQAEDTFLLRMRAKMIAANASVREVAAAIRADPHQVLDSFRQKCVDFVLGYLGVPAAQPTANPEAPVHTEPPAQQPFFKDVMSNDSKCNKRKASSSEETALKRRAIASENTDQPKTSLLKPEGGTAFTKRFRAELKRNLSAQQAPERQQTESVQDHEWDPSQPDPIPREARVPISRSVSTATQSTTLPKTQTKASEARPPAETAIAVADPDVEMPDRGPPTEIEFIQAKQREAHPSDNPVFPVALMLPGFLNSLEHLALPYDDKIAMYMFQYLDHELRFQLSAASIEHAVELAQDLRLQIHLPAIWRAVVKWLNDMRASYENFMRSLNNPPLTQSELDDIWIQTRTRELPVPNLSIENLDRARQLANDPALSAWSPTMAEIIRKALAEFERSHKPSTSRRGNGNRAGQSGARPANATGQSNGTQSGTSQVSGLSATHQSNGNQPSTNQALGNNATHQARGNQSGTNQTQRNAANPLSARRPIAVPTGTRNRYRNR